MWLNVSTRAERFTSIALLLFIVAVLVGILLPAEQRGRRFANRDQCKNNLKQIALALYNYHDTFGRFPAAYSVDEHGRPVNGWRTWILPYMDQGPLYNAYHFDEPWDGPNNSKLREKNISGFTCPSDPAKRDGRTNYLAVVGPSTAWPGIRGTNLNDDFPDGAANTILVVEVADSGIDWIEPRDLSFEDMNFQAAGAAGNSISSEHKRKGSWPWSRAVHVVNVLFADGHVESLPADTPPETIRALLTTNGGEKIAPRIQTPEQH